MSVFNVQPEDVTGEKRKASDDVEQLFQDVPVSGEPSSPSVLELPVKRSKMEENEVEHSYKEDCTCKDCFRREAIMSCQCEGCRKGDKCRSCEMWTYMGTIKEVKKADETPLSREVVEEVMGQKVHYHMQEGLAQEPRDVYWGIDTEEESVQEINLSSDEKLTYPSSPEQSYELSDEEDISDEDIKMYGFQLSAYTRQQRKADQMYAIERDKGEPTMFDVKWRGPKDSIWMNSMNMLRNLRSPSNKFRRHELTNSAELKDNKALRAVFYRQFGMNKYGSFTQVYDVRRNLTLMNIVKGMTENHSICRLMHAMYETLPTVVEHNCDVSYVDPSEAISSFAALLGYVNIKDSFLSTNPYTWQTNACGEDCITKQRNPMPEPLLSVLSNDLQYSRREIPHDAGAWGILPLEVVRHNFWQIMYRLEGSDDCNNVVHSGNRESGVLYNRDTIFRAQSIYKAMIAEHDVCYKFDNITPSAIDCIDSLLSNHSSSPDEIASSLSRVHGYEKRKKLNRAFYPALHTCIQGLCMHYVAKGSLTEEDQIKIKEEAVMQWYAEEWSVYRCNGCDVHTMGEKIYYDLTRDLYSGESHLGAGGCTTPSFIERLLNDIFTHEDVDGQDESSLVVNTIAAVMQKACVEVDLFEH